MEKNNLQTNKTLGIAYENHKKGNLELAKSLYEKILKKDSNNFEAIFLLGSLFLQTRNFDEAIRFLNKCIKVKVIPKVIVNNIINEIIQCFFTRYDNDNFAKIISRILPK